MPAEWRSIPTYVINVQVTSAHETEDFGDGQWPSISTW